MSPQIEQIEQIDPAAAAARIADGAVLVDVREPHEWQAGHIADAVHIPLGDLTARVGELPADRLVVAVCKLGGRSQKAAEFLSAQGYDVANLAGGTTAWHDAGREIVTDDGSPGTVA